MIGLACILVSKAEDLGGCTVDFEGEDLLPSGYVVGGIVPSLVLQAPKNETGRIARVEQVAEWLDKNGAEAYGSWLDSETGLIHIDAVSVYGPDELALALFVAGERGELAIWDATNGAEIRL